jgi:hypothetical protein
VRLEQGAIDRLIKIINDLNYVIEPFDYSNTHQLLSLTCDQKHQIKMSREQILKHSKKGTRKFCPICRKTWKNSSLELYQWQYGKSQGRILHEEYQSKIKRANTLERYIEKYGVEDGIGRYEKWKLSCRNNGCSLELFQSRYGIFDGTKKWDEYSKRVYRKRSLENYINELGPIDGLDKWEKYQHNLKRSKSIDRYIEKFGTDIGTQKYNAYLNKIKNISWKRVASKISLDHILPPIYEYGYRLNEIFIGLNPSKEFQLVYEDKIYWYDCVIPDIKLVIEFNSLAWHCSPELMTLEDFKSWKPPKGNSKPEEKYIYDLHKIRAVEHSGYEAIVIWQEHGLDYNHKLIKHMIKKRYLDSVAEL